MLNRILTVVKLSLFSGSAIAQAGTFEPTRESLSRYQVPEWYNDAKIGFFYHWGPQTALGDQWKRIGRSTALSQASRPSGTTDEAISAPFSA